jgi:hypothetical protein
LVVFSKTKYNNKKEFLLNNEEVEVKDSYTYLGLLFNYNGNFCQGRNKLVDQAQKDMYALYRKNYNLAIPVDLQLKLYDSLVTPILLYSSEIWGFECISNIEKKIICNFAKELYQLDLLHPSLWFMENCVDSR